MTTETVLTGEQIDVLLDGVLHASGSALRNYSLPKYINDMRDAVRAIEQAVLQSDKIKAMDGMASCMDMVRRELIEAGIITEQVAPMFVANAVLAEIQALRKDAERYRHIRPGDALVWCSCGNDLLTGECLDAEIDASIDVHGDEHGEQQP